ncbi:MAG TPA: hypothetical protein DCY88_05295, partial [Cyanobacteria bacterium UBA11372]|nr:hypothetical protein [Cyanobacteria bacterium UBA11372]
MANPIFNLSDLNGSNGFVIYVGNVVSNAGDVSGDGFDDLIIGVPYADYNGKSGVGLIYVLDGSNAGFASGGFSMNGMAAGDHLGYAVSSAGDVNGDGFDDVIMGAPYADSNGIWNSGQSYVVFGSNSGLRFSLSDLNGSNGFAINGIGWGDYSGFSVSSAGDVNGDGFDDVIIGALFNGFDGSTRAASYVVFGSNSGFGASLNLSNLNGSNGFAIKAISSDHRLGRSVSSAGDVNGDGIDDLIIGAPGSRQSYVVFGSKSGFSASLNLSDLNGSNGFVINGIGAGFSSDFSVSNAGDVNGDGIGDLIIGVSDADPNGIWDAGQSYVVFGSKSGFSASLNLSSLNGSNGFVINGIAADDRSGRSVSSAGDVNGDRIDDLIIGAPGADPNGISNAGQSYVVFGSKSGFGASFNLSDLNGNNGFAINGITAGDRSGNAVSNAGDVNGDRIDDVIIGAPFANSYGISNAGQSYVVFGFATNPPPVVTNQPPVAVNDAVSTNENTILNGNVLVANPTTPDSDPNNDTLTVAQVNANATNVGTTITLPSGALLSVNTNGDFTYNPNGKFDSLSAGATATDSFTYTISDGKGGRSSAIATVTINGVLSAVEPPQAVNDAVSTNEDTLLNGNVLAANPTTPDSDPNGDPLTVTQVNGNAANVGTTITLTSGALLSVNANGDFVYNPNGKFESLGAGGKAIDSFTYRIGDGFGGTSSATATVTINGVNDAPAAANPILNLSNLNGSQGFAINGIAADNYPGISVSSAGDINRDGFDDLIIGARFANSNGITNAGQSYVVFGSNNGFSGNLNLSNLNGSNGFVINGIEANDSSGRSVSSAGDVNGDGFDDLIIGAPGADPSGSFSGQSYVVFGSNNGFGASFNLSTLNGSNGFAINGIGWGDYSGTSVSSAGDVNGDGLDDLIIGAVYARVNGIRNVGQSYVVFGSKSSFGASFNLSTLNGSNGFAINGVAGGDYSGTSVSSAGDINGDGIDDLIIGASASQINGRSFGQSYVVFGSKSGFSPSLNLSNLNG